MKKEDINDQELDLSIGGVGIGEYMKANSKWGIIATIAAIIAAVSSVVTLIITVIG